MNSTNALTKDEVYEVLSSSRRRQILYHLYRRGGEAELREIARDTAEAENADAVTDDVVKRFYISLYQTHVPKLEEAGLVRYDSDDKTVAMTDRVSDIERILFDRVEDDHQWERYYASLAVIGFLVAIGQMTGIAPLATTPAFALTLLLLTTVQYYRTSVEEEEYAFLEKLVAN